MGNYWSNQREFVFFLCTLPLNKTLQDPKNTILLSTRHFQQNIKEEKAYLLIKDFTLFFGNISCQLDVIIDKFCKLNISHAVLKHSILKGRYNLLPLSSSTEKFSLCLISLEYMYVVFSIAFFFYCKWYNLQTCQRLFI